MRASLFSLRSVEESFHSGDGEGAEILRFFQTCSGCSGRRLSWAVSKAAMTTLYYNATIHTMDEATPRAEAMLVRADRIVAVGSTNEVDVAAARATRRVDLQGA